MRTLEELVARAIDHVCAMTGDLKSYSDFLTYLVDTVLPPLHAVIAAGHAATFALPHACARPGSFKRTRSHSADLARTAADHDERPTTVVR